MNNKEIFSRTELLIGNAALQKLAASRVIIFGTGGVGSFAVEALARAGVGNMTLIDFDTVDVTNINRQLPATVNTVGQKKVVLMKERIAVINPSATVTTIDKALTPNNAAEIFAAAAPLSYAVDAVDDIAAKVTIAEFCTEHNIPLIAAMGAGGKLDPTRFEVSDIFKTTVDPLARAMRKKLKERGIKKLKVVYSQETPQKRAAGSPVGSISFVPGAMGLILAGQVINDIIGANQGAVRK